VKRTKSEIRKDVWHRLLSVAYPDPVFDLDFSSFIPDFKGTGECVGRILGLEVWKKARLLFITPDNSLTRLREKAILQRARFVMTTYGIKRGFLLIQGSRISRADARFASTLYGCEELGKGMDLRDLRKAGRIDLVITGAAAVTLDGVRFGKGHGYFDIEWGILTAIESVDDETKIITVVHDCQVVDEQFEPDSFDTVTDFIVTPTRVIDVNAKRRRPSGIDWDNLSQELLSSIPPLQELAKERGRTNRGGT
jgi:5-formyltetrahydrofolate cyclo-ligase